MSNIPTPPASPITIISVKPNTGKHGDTIIITGTHFNLNASNDTVKFNGLPAVVQTASADTLLVIVPSGAGSGAVTVNRVTAPGPVFAYIQTVTVSTVAGSGMQIAPGGGFLGGYKDGPDSIAQFDAVFALSLDASGNIYVSDLGNNRVRKISAGLVSTLAGSGFSGFLDGADSAAAFFGPYGIAVDRQSNVYVADGFGHRIRKISGGQVSTLAGTGFPGVINGPDSVAQFYDPVGLAIDSTGLLYVVEVNDIRKISPAGVASSFAGGGTPGVGGYLDGPDTTARFNNPIGIAVDAQGNAYVADNINKRIRKITAAGLVTTLAGNGTQGFQDGPADSAEFYLLTGIAVDSQGNVYATDQNCIRKITPAGIVSTFVGTHIGGFVDGPALEALFSTPEGLAFDTQGNLFVADSGNQRIRKISFE